MLKNHKKPLRHRSDFAARVISIVRTIPKGKVMSYQAVAQCAGNAKAARAVGAVVAANADITIPCHRVVTADGRIGNYNGIRGDKKTLLEKEKVPMSPYGTIYPEGFIEQL